MKINTVKQRMLQGEPGIGAELGLGSPLSGEIMSQLGFDYIVADAQHGAWTEEKMMQAIRSIALGSAIPMARVRSNDFGLIGRLLDMGAMGVVVPMVNSVEEAEAVVHAGRYPPRGGRSGGNFGTSFLGDDYNEHADDQIWLAIQIETVQALERAEEILSVEGIDGCWVGPHDLSRSLGVDLDDPEDRKKHTAAIERVIEVCHQTNKVPGISVGDAATAKYWVDRGCLFTTCGEDTGWVIDGARAALSLFGR